MTILLWAIPIAAGLFIAVAACLRVGWMIGRRRVEAKGGNANEGLGSIDASIFGMMGLLIAFTFTGAANRFDHRRDLIVQESNAIGTAWLRLDLVPQPQRESIRQSMRDYVDQRIAAYRNMADQTATAQANQHAAELQNRIWADLQSAIRADPTVPIAQTVMPAINDMFDIASTRTLATEQHPPRAIYLMLLILVLVSAFLAGFGQAKTEHQSMWHLIGFAATTTVALYLTLDLEYPRVGFVRIDAFDQVLIDQRASMRPAST
jgi:hypothetical protein